MGFGISEPREEYERFRRNQYIYLLPKKPGVSQRSRVVFYEYILKLNGEDTRLRCYRVSVTDNIDDESCLIYDKLYNYDTAYHYNENAYNDAIKDFISQKSKYEKYFKP